MITLNANAARTGRLHREQRLGTVARRLGAIAVTDPLDRDRLLYHFVAFFDALHLALSSVRPDERLTTELESLMREAPAAGLPSMEEIGLRRNDASTWEVAYLDLEYQIQRRAGVLVACAAAFEQRFAGFLHAAFREAEPVAAA